MQRGQHSTDSDGLTLRPARADDERFLYEVYASTRIEELAPLGWDDAQREEFLTMQFRAQHDYYHAQFPDADYDLIVLDGRTIGRRYVHRREDEIKLLDIALLPEHRNRGLGTKLTEQLLAEAAGAGLPVRLHVEQFNPARRLYERFGFRPAQEDGIYLLMEWEPGAGAGVREAVGVEPAH